ncbi:MAG: calcium/sodium antiporter [Lachnospiraceae bacterium]|nr:calcium/sodium antiporter [bacterium]MDY5516598.1 calcium/sodium antiporter [Lachnospiraceae bacterium]
MILEIFLLVLGFAMLVKGADWFVDGTSGIARKLGIPQLVVGLTIVAMGTSAPEAAVSITAALKNNAGIAIGNVVGSNILNILIILGITAVLIPVAIQKSTLWIEIPYMLAVTIVLTLMGLDGRVSRIEGVLLWGMFLIYLAYLFYLAKCGTDAKEAVEESAWKLVICAVVGGVTVVWGSDITVDAATALAQLIGMSERLIGLTIVALGTSLPELVTSVTAARKGNADIAIGNIVGSNIFNILFVIGTAALIIPVPFADNFIIDGIIAVAAGVLLWIAVFRKLELRRPWGIVMLLGYGAYVISLLV